MRLTASKPAKRVALIAALGAGLLSATGCGYINAQQTTHQYSASDGVREDVGPLQLRNMIIVSSGTTGSSSTLSADAPGRLTGTIFNTSDKSVPLTFRDASSTVRLDVPAKGEINLGDEAHQVNLAKTGAVPGALAKITFSADSASKDVSVPVLDGTLPEYRTLIPTPSGSASASPSGSASGSASASPSGSATPSGSASASATSSATPSR
ncbi:hypothetical protein [Sinomonas sp. R1AF57]|uniref:hypothetical protein n=1 Tax=Sinomonas sp. R1AF57 TaxID=2020377 RepID=UPI000B5EA878|nr:hypothetical protein [Sinomonas sp. R1AF57]ASN51055.1 hypothetical protein CGQ25_02350 [Sinomonas sp. R1AF57]